MGKSLTRWLAERELRSLSRRVPERATQIDRSSVPVTVEVDDTPMELDYPVPDLLGEGVRAGQQADAAREESEFAKNLAEQLETELVDAIQLAADAKATADGKNARRRGVTEPAPPEGGWAQGDQWVRDVLDENDQPKPVEVLVWDGSEFVHESTLTGELLVVGPNGNIRLADGVVASNSLMADAIDGMTITGALVRTAETGQRLELDVAGLKAINQNGNTVATLGSDATGLSIYGPAGSVWINAANVSAGVRYVSNPTRGPWDGSRGSMDSTSGVESYRDNAGVLHSQVRTRTTRLNFEGTNVDNDFEAPEFTAWVKRREDGSTAGGFDFNNVDRVSFRSLYGANWRLTELVHDLRVTNPGNTFETFAELNAWGPIDGTRAWVTAENREYVRVNGVWRAAPDLNKDHDWYDLPYTSGHQPGTAGRMQVARIGGVVYFRGGGQRNSGNFATNSETTISTGVPYWAVPDQHIRFAGVGAAGRPCMMLISTAGEVKVSVRSELGGSAWISGTISYPGVI